MNARWNFDDVDVLTFDCYGTLIDWETGLWEALAPILRAHDIDADRERLLALYGAHEAEVERGPYVRYADVLRTVLQQLGDELGFAPTGEELQRFSRSVADWPPFADSAAALQKLHRRFRLAILSNVDDDLFAFSARKLETEFDFVITAQQLGTYKPSPNNFEQALARIGVPRERLLHVAQSLFHDIAPARALGLKTVWVNRRKGQAGSGATPPADATPDLEVPDLRTLAELAG